MEDLSQLGERYGAFGTQSPQEPPPLSKLGDMVVGAYQGLEGLARRAFNASSGDLQHLGDHSYEPQSIGPGLEGALMAMTGGVAGTGQGGIALGSGPIRAYHGSPHDFDRFDLSKIGTGEGAQAYGHGLYFAENEGVAKAYRDALADWKVNGVPADPANPSHIAAATLKNYNGDATAAINDLSKSATVGPEAERAAASQAIQMIKSNAQLPPVTGGRMYEVNINADPAHFLDWDKPLSQQPQSVQDVFAKHGITEPKVPPPYWMNDAANQLASKEGSWERAAGARNVTDKLAEAGIPGIKYLDQGSRGSGQGSSNYVVFNDRIIDIMRKYGLAGIPAAGAVLAGQDRE